MYAFMLLSLLLTSTAVALPKPVQLLEGYGWWGLRSLEPSNSIAETLHEFESEVTATDKHNPGIIFDIDARDVNEAQEELAGVYYCDDVAWGGACRYLQTPLGGAPEDCTPINERASSIGPDPGVYCIFYTNFFCDSIASDLSDQLTLSFPGSDNLGHTVKGDFNDNLRSYHCFKETVSIEDSGAASSAGEDGA